MAEKRQKIKRRGFGRKKKVTPVTPVTNEKLLEDILKRGVTDIVPRLEFERKLRAGERIRVYLGVDPTGPSIHLGHAVILRKLRQLQDLGHEVILLVGDFTARIGDPTDREAARTTMTHKQVLANAQHYKEQAAKILDFSRSHRSPARLDFNARWLDKLRFQDVMELAAHFTVQQMLERDMFEKRLTQDKPIYVHEFFYPLMQGYDSVAMDVDMEVGGNDQLFNMLAGRSLQKIYNNREKVVMTFEFLEGLDGRKMSKSYGNIVGVTDAPNEMYGKIMSLADSMIARYFWLCTDATASDVAAVKQELVAGTNPRDVKMRLARTIVALYHSEKAAVAAEQEFVAVFQQKGRPAEMPTYVVKSTDKTIVDLVIAAGCASSKGEARRLVEQGGVRVNEVKVTNVSVALQIRDNDILQVGKRKFVRLQSRL